jgi:hypothetical protein
LPLALSGVVLLLLLLIVLKVFFFAGAGCPLLCGLAFSEGATSSDYSIAAFIIEPDSDSFFALLLVAADDSPLSSSSSYYKFEPPKF